MSSDDLMANESAIRQTLYRAAANTPGGDQQMEIIVNTVIEFHGDLARATSVRLVLGGHPRAPEVVLCDRVQDDLVLGPAGVWEHQRRIVPGERTV